MSILSGGILGNGQSLKGQRVGSLQLAAGTYTAESEITSWVLESGLPNAFSLNTDATRINLPRTRVSNSHTGYLYQILHNGLVVDEFWQNFNVPIQGTIKMIADIRKWNQFTADKFQGELPTDPEILSGTPVDTFYFNTTNNHFRVVVDEDGVLVYETPADARSVLGVNGRFRGVFNSENDATDNLPTDAVADDFTYYAYFDGHVRVYVRQLKELWARLWAGDDKYAALVAPATDLVIEDNDNIRAEIFLAEN